MYFEEARNGHMIVGRWLIEEQISRIQWEVQGNFGELNQFIWVMLHIIIEAGLL